MSSFDSSKSAEQTQRDTEEVQRDIDETKEERAEEYLGRPVGKTRAKLLRRMSRMHSENEDLRTRLAKYESVQQPPAQQPQQNSDGSQEAEQQQAQQPLPRSQEELRWQAAQLEAQITYPLKVELAKQRYPDFEESLNAAKNEVPLWTLDAMRMMPNGPDVAYWLSKNPARADELLRLDREGRGQEAYGLLHSISSGLSLGQLHNGSSQQARPRKSAAPAPINPVGGGASREGGDPSRMQYRDYVKWYGQHYGGKR